MAFVGTGIGQTPVPSVPASRPAAEAVKPADGYTPARQGIKVSGWWNIDVKNADGTFAAHREFENSLVSNEVLPALLLGNITLGPPFVVVSGSPAPCVVQGTPFACTMALATFANCTAATACFKTLTREAHLVGTPPLADGVLLSASFTVGVATSLDFVSTQYNFCGHIPLRDNVGVFAASSPAGCNGNSFAGDPVFGAQLTRFTLNGTGNSAPIPVTAGQLVQISVLLTFS